MATLHAKERNALPAKKFALPAERKYPINDASHAAKAKGRATEMEHKGVISSSTKAKIDAAANRVLGGSGHMPKGDSKPTSHWSKH